MSSDKVNTNIDTYRFNNGNEKIYTSLNFKVDTKGNVNFGGELIKTYTHLGALNRQMDEDIGSVLYFGDVKNGKAKIINNSVTYNYDNNVIYATVTTVDNKGVLQYVLNRIYPEHNKKQFKTTIEDLNAYTNVNYN